MKPVTRSEAVAVTIGRKVRERRLVNGLSEEAVARVLGLEVSDLQHAESGQANFTAKAIVELCAILRVQPSWFFEDLV